MRPQKPPRGMTILTLGPGIELVTVAELARFFEPYGMTPVRMQQWLTVLGVRRVEFPGGMEVVDYWRFAVAVAAFFGRPYGEVAVSVPGASSYPVPIPSSTDTEALRREALGHMLLAQQQASAMTPAAVASAAAWWLKRASESLKSDMLSVLGPSYREAITKALALQEPPTP